MHAKVYIHQEIVEQALSRTVDQVCENKDIPVSYKIWLAQGSDIKLKK